MTALRIRGGTRVGFGSFDDSSAGKDGESRVSPDRHVIYRQAVLLDERQIESIDDSFTTDTVYEVVVKGEEFSLCPVSVDPPLLTEFPAEDEDDSTTDRVRRGRCRPWEGLRFRWGWGGGLA